VISVEWWVFPLTLAGRLSSVYLWRCKAKNENNHEDAEYTENRRIEKGGEYRIFFLLVFSVFSVPLW
jgi:hypothetical protein